MSLQQLLKINMQDKKDYCSFCGDFTFDYIRSIKRKYQRLCFSCIDTAVVIRKKAVLVEKQLDLNIKNE